jgi:hypothetical protein
MQLTDAPILERSKLSAVRLDLREPNRSPMVNGRHVITHGLLHQTRASLKRRFRVVLVGQVYFSGFHRTSPQEIC